MVVRGSILPRQDLFYLVVPRKFDEVTLLSYLQRPFLPFTPDAWLGVFAFLCGLSAVLWLVRLCETPAKERQGCQRSLQDRQDGSSSPAWFGAPD